MSFRNRLTSFFVVIVLAPMLAMGVLALRLIAQSNTAKGKARAEGIAGVASSLYVHEEFGARAAALALLPEFAGKSPAEIRQLLASGPPPGIARVIVARNGAVVADVGSQGAIAPGAARESGPGGYNVIVSTTTAFGYAQALSGPDTAVAVFAGSRPLASTASATVSAGASGTVRVGGTQYNVARLGSLPALGGPLISVVVLSDDQATSSSGATSRIVAVVFVAGFALLAFSFAVLASRGLGNQVARFLGAAQRLGGGDFSSPVPVEGSDEFAMLATEFNNMSHQLEDRLEQLDAERRRLRESIRRAGETFASTLNEDALLPLALETALDGTEAGFGRLTARAASDGPLQHRLQSGSLEDVQPQVLAAEAAALHELGLGAAEGDGVYVMSSALGPLNALGRPLGLITVGRRERPFTAADREMLRSLVGQASMAIDNTRMHEEANRRATTDLLTELVNHGRFQELLSHELERARRYRYPVGLIMLDIDSFKQVNDVYGHPQGDLVLRSVARVLQHSSREGDIPARYGGEEMAMILPHTDLDGSYAIAERLRRSIAALEIPMADGEGKLAITVSVGVGASTDQPKEALIAETDAALYQAKRGGKNRTERATSLATNVVPAE